MSMDGAVDTRALEHLSKGHRAVALMTSLLRPYVTKVAREDRGVFLSVLELRRNWYISGTDLLKQFINDCNDRANRIQYAVQEYVLMWSISTPEA